MSRFVVFLSALASLAALFFSVPAFADEAAARAHFSKGIDLYDKKQFAQAQVEFEAAYKDKPSAGIKQNIALCLKELNKPAEAATAFDEALDEGKDKLKPEVKEKIERELADLSKTVATVQITIAGADDKRVSETVITVQPAGQAARSLPPGGQRRPIRVMPGMYTFSAKIPGVPPPEPKKLALISGAPTEVTFGEQAVGASTLNIHTNVPEAQIKIDGVEVGKGSWQGPVTASRKLRVEVSANNYRSLAFDITVPANSTVDSPINLQPTGNAPPEYRTPGTNTQPEKPRGRIYLAINGSLEASSYRLSSFGGAPTTEGLRKTYGGGTVGGRFGFLANKNVALEAFAEVGGAVTSLDPPKTGDPKYQATIVHWMIAPALRFQTSGKVRFTAGLGAGVHGMSFKNEPQSITVTTVGGTGTGTTSTPTGKTTEGKGVAFAWFLDAGVQFDVGPLFMEVVAFANFHGVGSVEEEESGRRAFLAAPGYRIGPRVALGIPF